jgi:hypothetical protein
MFDIGSVAPFTRDGTSILFFTKGFGRGHAMPDLAIVEALKRCCTETPNVTFVSYGTGAATLRANGSDVIDLEMPDNNPLLDTIVYSTQLTSHLTPRLIIAHEEVAPLLAAKAFNIPCLFITDFFQEATMLTTKLIEYANEVIFIGDRGVFT